jgi:hypothetical protein
MARAPLDTGNARGKDHQQPTSDKGLAMAMLVFAIGMLTLFAVLALADVVGLAHILPFVGLPLGLLAIAAALVWHWLSGEARASAAFELARRDREEGRRR